VSIRLATVIPTVPDPTGGFEFASDARLYWRRHRGWVAVAACLGAPSQLVSIRWEHCRRSVPRGCWVRAARAVGAQTLTRLCLSWLFEDQEVVAKAEHCQESVDRASVNDDEEEESPSRLAQAAVAV
jgi:hypothetical protein